MTAPASTTTSDAGTTTSTTEGQQTQTGTTTPPVVPPGATTAQQAPTTGTSTTAAPGDGLPDDPAALKAEILRLRGENASTRTNAKAQAADDARKQLAQEIGKALGLVADETDPAKLTEKLTASQAESTDTKRELAVFKAAAGAGADPAKLLDSRSFLATVKNIDPTDAAAIAAAVKVAVDTNPAFKLAQAPAAGASTVDHAGGSGEGAVTLEQFKAMGYAERVQLYQSNKALYDQLSAAATAVPR